MMRMIWGTIKLTPFYWLPVFSNIPLPNLLREGAFLREYRKITDHHDLPIHRDALALETNRLGSRHHQLEPAKNSDFLDPSIADHWKSLWEAIASTNLHHMPCINTIPPGFNLSWKIWTTLNRISTNSGMTATDKFLTGTQSVIDYVCNLDVICELLCDTIYTLYIYSCILYITCYTEYCIFIFLDDVLCSIS